MILRAVKLTAQVREFPPDTEAAGSVSLSRLREDLRPWGYQITTQVGLLLPLQATVILGLAGGMGRGGGGGG